MAGRHHKSPLGINPPYFWRINKSQVHWDRILYFGTSFAYLINVTTQVQSSGFKVQWLFAEPLTVKRGFFMSRLRSLGMDNGSWLQVEPLSCEP